MANLVPGIVQDGKVIPKTPLPDGLNVQILVPDPCDAADAELIAEMAAWRAGSAKAFARVEEIAEAEAKNAQG